MMLLLIHDVSILLRIIPLVPVGEGNRVEELHGKDWMKGTGKEKNPEP
jgi:hypothetical protein